jgi:Rrf2 family protein
MLSVSCKASIKAVTYLGSRLHKEDRADIKTVAYSINENEHTVAKLLRRLVNAGIINSTKGPGGGFSISDDQKKLALIDVVKAIDGKEVFTHCGLGFPRCDHSHPCPFHRHYKKVRDSFKETCESSTIEDFCNSVTAKRAFLSSKTQVI